MYNFVKINPNIIDWNRIENAVDSTVFHTQQWDNYLHRIGYKTIVIEVSLSHQTIGYFIGEKIGWGSLSLVAAPFNGIGTYSQGLVMLKTTAEKVRINIYKELAEWLFLNKITSLLQVDDWSLRKTSAKWIPYDVFHHEILESESVLYKIRPTLCVPVNTSIDIMWAGLHYKSAKYSINKATKLGLYIHEITDKAEIPSFTKYHYSQLVEVCAKQGMRPKPSQSQKRMQAVCEELFPSRVIMLECRGKDDNGIEQIMSTGIFCIDKGESIYWTGASFQRYQKFCPNELMVWKAMILCYERGAGILNFGGMASYKLKFGTVYEYVPRISFIKHKWIYIIKDSAQIGYFSIRGFIAKIIGRHSFK